MGGKGKEGGAFGYEALLVAVFWVAGICVRDVV